MTRPCTRSTCEESTDGAVLPQSTTSPPMSTPLRCPSGLLSLPTLVRTLLSRSVPRTHLPTPVNDAHDTNVDFTSDWLTSFLVPLLANPSFNDNRTVILLTFDESESYNLNNNVYTLALGGGLPKELIGTIDSTYYTHYSTLSTVQANWGLGSLGRGDTNKYVPFLPTSLMYLTSMTPGL